MKRAVLLISPIDDANLYVIRNVLQHRKIDSYHIDITQKRKPSDIDFLISSDASSARIWDSFGIPFSPEDISGVWCRSSAFHQHAPPVVGTVENFIRNEEVYSLEYLFFLLENATWVNPIFPPFLTRRSIANRLIQARLASSIGLQIPTQVVSNSMDSLREFESRSSSVSVANKQIAQGSSSEAGPVVVLTRKIDAHELEKQDERCRCPILLQEYIEKEYEIRAIVVGNTVYAAAVDTARPGFDFVDSRESFKSDLTYYRIELDHDEIAKLIKLNQMLGLRYSAVDLIRKVDGTLVFLETNPSGQWGFIETFTGYPITERIVEELLQ